MHRLHQEILRAEEATLEGHREGTALKTTQQIHHGGTGNKIGLLNLVEV